MRNPFIINTKSGLNSNLFHKQSWFNVQLVISYSGFPRMSQPLIDIGVNLSNNRFKEDLDAILDGTPEEKQTLLFSATFPEDIEELGQKIGKNWMKMGIEKPLL